MQRHLGPLFGGDELVTGLAQAGVDHQHVALGDVPLLETAVDHLLQRYDQPHILPHGGGVELQRREVPIGIVGRVADLQPRELLVAQGDVVTRPGSIYGGPHRPSAVDHLHELRQNAESPPLGIVGTPDRGGKTPVERKLRQKTRAGLSETLCGGFGPGSGGLELPAVPEHGAPVVAEGSLRGKRRATKQAKEGKGAFHAWRML